MFNFNLNNVNNNNNINNNKLNIIKSIIKNLLNKKNNDNINNNNITITEIIISNEKIFILNIKNSNIIIIGIFSLLSKNSIINLFLYHLAASFFNFIGEKSDYVSINTYFNTGNDKLKGKIYETFLFLPLLNHFIDIIYSLFKKKSLFMTNLKYENFLIIDLNSKHIIFKFNTLLKKKLFNISNFDSLLDELIFHSLNLKEMYSKKYSNRFDSIEYQDYYVKLEYTSTYPRLTFMIKFLPVLKGLALIHIYSTSKLSRQENEGNKIYKEFDVIYGVVDNYYNNGNNSNSSIKENHLEYKFNEPKMLKEIETFFIEFLISSHSAFGVFYFPKDEFKYFNKDIINIINEIIKENDNNNNNDENNENFVISKITKKLYDEYLIENRKDKDINDISMQNINNNNNNENNNINNNELVSSYQWNFLNIKKEISNLFQISKKFSLEIIFKNIKINNDINPDDVTINLTKIEDENSINNNKLDDLINNDQSYILRTNSFLINKNDVKMSRKLSSVSYNDNISINSSNLKKDINIIKKTVSNNQIIFNEEQILTFKSKNKNNNNNNDNEDINSKRQISEGNENSKLIEEKFNYLQKKNIFNEEDIEDDNN